MYIYPQYALRSEKDMIANLLTSMRKEENYEKKRGHSSSSLIPTYNSYIGSIYYPVSTPPYTEHFDSFFTVSELKLIECFNLSIGPNIKLVKSTIYGCSIEYYYDRFTDGFDVGTTTEHQQSKRFIIKLKSGKVYRSVPYRYRRFNQEVGNALIQRISIIYYRCGQIIEGESPV